MVKRTYRVCKRVVLGTILVAATLVVVAAIRLMEGPIDLDFLKPRIAAAVDVPGNDIKPEFDRISMEWGGISQPVRLSFTGLRFVNTRLHQVIATAPSASLTFDVRSLIQGMLLPTSLTIVGATLQADINREGGMLRRVFADSSAGSQSEAVSLLVDQLFAEPNYNSLLGQLDTIQIERTKVTLRDVATGLTWVAPSAHARLSRDTAGVSISAEAAITGEAGNYVDVALSGVYTRDRSRMSLTAEVSGFKPSMLADLSPDVALLRGVDIGLSGRLRIEADGQGDVRHIAFDVTGGNGHVTLPGVLPVTHEVKSVNARATVDAQTHSAKIEHADIDFGAARISITGAGERRGDGQVFSGRAAVSQIPVDRLGNYWPLALAVGGRDWALANLGNGEIDVAAEFEISTPGNDLAALKVDRLIGLIDYRDMTVRYMPQMPELHGVSGKARFEGSTLHFDIASGTAAGLTTTGATVDLQDLDKPPPQYAAIRLPIAGSAQDVIRFLARPKLGLPKDVLFDPSRLGGDVAVDLSVRFPLLNALTVAELELKTEATLSNFSLRDAIGDVDLRDATARIKYSGSELDVSGTAKLDTASVEIGWREMFGAKVPFRRRYELKGTIPSSLVAKAGFPSPEPFVTGPVGTVLTYQVAASGAASEVNARFDLKAAKADVPPLAWSKPAGAEGSAQMTAKLAAGSKLSAIDFEARGEGLNSKGTLQFDGDSVLQQITVAQLRLGQTDVAGEWRRVPDGVEIALRGTLLELPRVRDMLKVRDDIAAKNPGGLAATSHSNTRLTLQLQQVLTRHGSIGYTNGTLQLAGERIATADLSIGVGRGSTLRVTPTGQGRKLFFYVANFGQALHDAGWLDGLADGYLHIEGQYNDAAAGSPLSGFVKLGPYRMEKVTPRPEIGTLNAAIDGLGRAGNALQQFEGLDANITKQGDRIGIRNGHTSGPSIGLTAQGYVDIGNETARLSGIVVPAFAFNNLLSNLPLLGPLLTGGRDGGLFAVKYQLSGPLDDLKTDVNMMSAMTPGALRDLFASDAAQGTP